MSLRLLKGLPLEDYHGVHVGIMAHANTSANFRSALRAYPCENQGFCDAIGGPCPFIGRERKCAARSLILERTVKMCDSGVFTQQGARVDYARLFSLYEDMGVQFGVIIDVLRNPELTLTSAALALREYGRVGRPFELVAVAHGATEAEYLSSYESLRSMGYARIAVGGLLRRRANTVRYASVVDDQFALNVLGAIRDRYPTDWLFALGCFHPSRLEDLARLGVWADYKGWIFKYRKRADTVRSLFQLDKSLGPSRVSSGSRSGRAERFARRIQSAGKRKKAAESDVHRGRLIIRSSIRHLRDHLPSGDPDATALDKLGGQSVFSPSEERRLLVIATRVLGTACVETELLLTAVQRQRGLLRRLSRLERLLDVYSDLYVSELRQFGGVGELRSILRAAEVMSMTEREHRFEQVRSAIKSGVLAELSTLSLPTSA